MHNVCGKCWLCTDKAVHKKIRGVHTQGRADTRRCVATARFLLFKGGVEACPHVERSELFDEGSEMRCTICVAMVGSAHPRRCIHKVVRIEGSVYTKHNTHKAVCCHRRSLDI